MKGYISGATGFLGRIAASHFVAQDCSLTLAGRNYEELKNLRIDLLEKTTSSSISIDLHVLDFSIPKSIEQQLNDIEVESYDWCINAIGIQGNVNRDLELTFLDYEKTLAVNLLSPIELTRYFAKYFSMKKRGKIIHFSGGGSANARPYFSPYSISKTALARYVENMALELVENNVQIFLISPGLMPSNMLINSLNRPEFLDKNQIDSIKSAIDGRSKYDSGKILDLINFLLSESGSFCSGKMISALWDNWQEWPNHRDQITDTDLFTLRRIAGRDRGQEWGDI